MARCDRPVDLLAEIARLEARVAELRAQHDAQLLVTIATASRSRAFTATELAQHAHVVDGTLWIALTQAGLTSPRKLGKKLQALQGREIGGLRLERIGTNNYGRIWSVEVVADSHLDR